MMMRPLLLSAILLGSVAAAQAERIEHQYFPNPHPEFQSRWAMPFPHGRADPELANRIIATSQPTEVRLMIPAPYAGREVRLFLSVAPIVPGLRGGRGGLEIEWTTEGALRPGRARPGDRTIVFEGVAPSGMLVDHIHYVVQIDDRDVDGELHVEPVFEIEAR